MSLVRRLVPSWLRRFARDEGSAPSRLERFARDETGVITAQSLFLFMTCCAVGSAATDVTHLYAAKSQLQVMADVAAHTALYQRAKKRVSPSRARRLAIRAVEYSMPDSYYGEVLDGSDIVFGDWSIRRTRFYERPDSRPPGFNFYANPPTGFSDAVMVTTRREEAGGNPVSTFLLRIVGLPWMDVEAVSIFIIYEPQCLREGFSAQRVVDVNSNSGFFRGFCMHSNSFVSLNMNNTFERGTVVSMPDLSLLDAETDPAKNPGLLEALHESYSYFHILDRIRAGAEDPLWTAVETPGQEERPSYLTIAAIAPPTSVPNKGLEINPAALDPNRVHKYDCGTDTSRKITLKSPTSDEATFANLAISTNCQIELSGNIRLENVMLYTTNTSANSVLVNTAGGGGGSGGGLYVGRPDNCGRGNGAQIITRGGFHASSSINLNGAKIIALGDVHFQSNAVGQGAAIISGGLIDTTSNVSFSGCGTGTDDNLRVPYFRPVW